MSKTENDIVLVNIDANRDRKEYEMYKFGISKGKNLEMETISLLEKLGFPLEKDGTFFYKTVIVKTANLIDTYTESELVNLLNSPYNSFYQRIAREYYDIGLKSFHAIILDAIESIDDSHVNKELSDKVFNGSKASYGTQAIKIAKYIKQTTKTAEDIIVK